MPVKLHVLSDLLHCHPVKLWTRMWVESTSQVPVVTDAIQHLDDELVTILIMKYTHTHSVFQKKPHTV